MWSLQEKGHNLPAHLLLSYILSSVCLLEIREVLGKGLGKRFHMHIHNRFAFPKGNKNGASQGWKKKGEDSWKNCELRYRERERLIVIWYRWLNTKIFK